MYLPTVDPVLWWARRPAPVRHARSRRQQLRCADEEQVRPGRYAGMRPQLIEPSQFARHLRSSRARLARSDAHDAGCRDHSHGNDRVIGGCKPPVNTFPVAPPD